MKTNILQIFGVCALMGAALTSCHDEPNVPTGGEKGTGELNLMSLSVDMTEAEKVVNSTAGRASTDVSDFIVTIRDLNDESAAPRTWRYAEMPEVVTLPVSDNYVVEVESHKIQKAEWERPYYKGSLNFAITPGEITNVGTITAKFASLKVTVVYDESLLSLLGDDAKVTITANDEGTLVYTRADVEARRPGYFEVIDNSTTMIATFEGTVDGMKTTYATPFATVEAGQHHIITYKAKSGPSIPDQTGNIDPNGGITLEADVKIVDISTGVVIEEDQLDSSDRPGQEEYEDPGKDDPNNPDNPDNPEGPAATFETYDSPKLKLDGVNNPFDFIISDSEFENAIVRIGCEKGIQALNVDITTTNDSFKASVGEFLPLSFELVNPGDAKAGLESLELPTGDQVKDKNEVMFNITNFVPLLSGFKGTHTFIITVTDNNGDKASISLVFETK